jgi:hypothetical protein
MWGTSQAAISIAAAKSGLSVKMLDTGYNIPLHLLDRLDALPSRIIHVHYHWLFGGGFELNPILDGRLPLTSVQKEWLRERLPLVPPESRSRFQKLNRLISRARL